MGTSIIHRTRFAFRIGFHKESSEIRNETIDFVCLVLPPLAHILIKGVSRRKSTNRLRRSKIHTEIDFDTVRTQHIGNALGFLQLFFAQHERLRIHIVQNRGIDTNRSIGTSVCFPNLFFRRQLCALGRSLLCFIQKSGSTRQTIHLIGRCIYMTSLRLGTILPEDAASRKSTLDSAIGIVPMVQDADVVARSLTHSSLQRLVHCLHS